MWRLTRQEGRGVPADKCGLWAIWDTVTDHLILWDATKEEILRFEPGYADLDRFFRAGRSNFASGLYDYLQQMEESDGCVSGKCEECNDTAADRWWVKNGNLLRLFAEDHEKEKAANLKWRAWEKLHPNSRKHKESCRSRKCSQRIDNTICIDSMVQL